ncbi:TOMM precursor leader peptide-binding protein [Streptomyces sp. NBC_00299]|uniref:TOMM precursor leader peptide-binding protein n=1 Tax=Streptomyces sp. NBC_00299 TaxID=2975705 RepID=UPI002E2D4095|nr:TOMM precursor leader peptide-binding protein [Streptomyces sp. NBC_00299]
MLSARYDAVAATRPRIRRDVLFTETPDGVLFHNADGGFRLTAKSAYRFATLLVPHFDGEHTVAEICEGFGDRQRAMVGELVGTLYERGFARDAPAGPAADSSAEPEPSADVARRFEAQIAYVDHYADDATRRFQRFRNTRVAVVGTGLVARWCALSLIRNGGAAVGVLPGLDREAIAEEAAAATAEGCPVEVRDLADGPVTWDSLDGYDVVVVTGGPHAPRVILALLRAGVPAGRTLLPAWSFGRHSVAGPAMSAQTTGCWACAVLRLGANGASSQAADVWSALALDLPAGTPVPGGPLSAMLGNLLGFEVFKSATGALPAETAGQLIVQDTESLDVASEPLLPHPRCPFCADDAPAEVPEVDLATADTDALALPTVDTAREADELVAELNRRSVLLRPHAGVFRRYDDEDITQTPLKLSAVELGVGHGRPRRIAAADVHHVAGARLRALHRAAETYAEHVVPHARTTAPEPAVRLAPAELATATGIGGAEADVREWEAAVSLLTKERFLVPGEAVRPFGAGNPERLFEATSAGMRAGASVSDAAAQGMLSVLAYDALRRAVRGAAVPGVTVPADADPELTFLMRSAVNLGVEAELLDLGERERSGVSVVLARAGTRWSVGAELSYRAAAVAALRELLGQVQLEQQGPADDTSFGDPVLSDLDPRALTVIGTVTADPDAVTSWADVLRRLGEQARDALVVPTGSADLERAGIHVVRVLLTSEARRVG